MPDIGAGAAGTPVPARLAGRAQVDLRAPAFISDLHLCAQRPATLGRFLAWLDTLPGQAAELVILGDLFEYWAGDDTLDASAADDGVGAAVADALAALGGRGVALYVMHGNRDLLLGGAFLARSGAQLLADPALARVGSGAQAQTWLLAHGDAYCTRDLPYQAFRRQARDAAFQAGFLAQPLAQRRALIGQARAHSEAGKQQLATQIMDVTPEAIAAALRAAGVPRLLHGHTHRPGHHRFELDGAAAERRVLPDWDLESEPVRGGGLRWDGRALVALAPPVPGAGAPGVGDG